MKTSASLKKARLVLSLLLCCLLVAGSLGLTAAADVDGPPAETAEESQPDTNIDDAAIDGETEPAPDAGLSPDEAAEPPECGNITVTFDFGDFGTVTQTLLPGTKPESVPDIPEEYSWQGYVVTGWLKGTDGLDGVGEPADPLETVVEEDTTFTALMERSVSALLNTDEHKAYIHGITDEIFNTHGSLLRAEAAMLFCNLLRNKDFDYSIDFSDVKPTEWFAEAVGRVNALGIASGREGGKFSPKENITRAEFIKMAVECDSLVDAECPFPDVPENHWARAYISSAYAKGWIQGDANGRFRPSDKISRAEAVIILNNMLGRQPDGDIKNKPGTRSFCDVFPDHWAYGNIIEAATDHEFTASEETGEQWTEYTRYEPTKKRGWISGGGKRYYIGSDGMALRGEQTIGGVKYRFDKTGAGATGFFAEGKWKRYYKNGELVEDISNLGVVKGPYYIKVYKPANYLIIFAKDSSGKYNIPVRSMLTSCGEPTTTGDYYTPARYRWLEMVGGSWAQWCTQIYSGYLFHSVPNDLRNNYTMWSNEYNNLGTTRSLGCIRLNCRDAKWIYDNCVLGTHVYISPSETSGPLKKPTGLKLPSWHTWDPTDPTAQHLCDQHGCH